MFEPQIVNLIREQAKVNETTGELSPEVLAYIYKHRLFKLFVPKEFGGNLTPLPEALKIFAEAAKIDGSFGWLVTIGAGGGFFVSSLTKEAGREIFYPENAVIAGSGQATGKAVKKDGGYYVTGNWRYCSGAPHATTFTANCVIEDETGEEDGQIRSVALAPNQIKIIKDWNALGLNGTASHTIITENAFVPKERTFSIYEKLSFSEEPIYNFPFLPFSQTSFTAIVIGMCRHFFEEARELADKRAVSWDVIPGRSKFVFEQIETAEKRFNEMIKAFEQMVGEKWMKHTEGDGLTEDDERELSAICVDTAAAGRQAVNEVFPCLGMEVIKEGNIILAIWKDIQTAGQHLLLSPIFK